MKKLFNSSLSIVTAAFVLLAVACAVPYQPTIPNIPLPKVFAGNELQERVLAGTVQLSCAERCMDRAALHAEIETLYEAGRWRLLGLLIAHEGVGDSHTYYFLAVAVWKQGAHEAAEIYMKASRDMWDAGRVCRECEFPSDIPADLILLRNYMQIETEHRCKWDIPTRCCTRGVVISGVQICHD